MTGESKFTFECLIFQFNRVDILSVSIDIIVKEICSFQTVSDKSFVTSCFILKNTPGIDIVK